MKHFATSAAAIAATLACAQASAAFNGHPVSGWTYYEIGVQPISTIDVENFANNIEAYYLLPLPFPDPAPSIADPLMINSYVIQAANDQAAAGIFGAWVSGQMTLQQIQAMAKGTIHTICTNMGGAPPVLVFKSTDDSNEVPNLVAQCTAVANFNGEQIAMTGVSNLTAFEGNYQSCWTQPPYPVATELGVSAGTGVFNRARGELQVNAVQLFNPFTQTCAQPGPVKRLKWTLSMH